ncbi:hypothetical protein [Halomarina oriensis]|uniref:Uncharacterized protein n=1 Tax=Halomarina oriensis TaxID=671145 RepID=A0A6B0GJ85_9EURY|nr:hypothetical protein [Halomarina oriensis]MWG34844.1 hypothetical protein [Halomarina oriensis]
MSLTADVDDPKMVPALCRRGVVVRLDSKAGRHIVKRHPAGTLNDRGEFAVIGHGPGGGYYDAWTTDAGTVVSFAERAGVENITEGSWPADRGLPPMGETR